MHDATVVVRRVRLVKPSWVRGMIRRVRQATTLKRRRQPRNDGVPRRRWPRRERPRVAAHDIGRRRTVKRLLSEYELALLVDAAAHNARPRLRVDAKGL